MKGVGGMEKQSNKTKSGRRDWRLQSNTRCLSINKMNWNEWRDDERKENAGEEKDLFASSGLMSQQHL